MLKSAILFISLVFMLSSNTWAQKNYDRPYKITFLAGWNYSKYKIGDDGPSVSDYKSGFFFGLNKDVRILPFLWSNLGLLYYQNGAKTDEGTYKFNYLMAPAGVKLKFGPVFGMAGVYGAYRLTGKIDDEKLDQKNYNRFDFGTYLGAGIKFMIFTFNLKYNWGASDVTNGSSSNSPKYDLRNRFFSLTFGIGIP